LRSGWLACDTRVDRGSRDVAQRKFDSTLGLRFGARGKAMLQLFLTADHSGTLHSTLAPSYVFTPKKGGASYQFGLEAKNGTKAELGVKFGLWRRF